MLADSSVVALTRRSFPKHALNELCPYCGAAFADYPLIMSDDASQTVTMLPVRSNSPPISWSISTPSFVHQLHAPICLLSHHQYPFCTRKEEAMQTTDLEEIKVALWEQSHHPCTRVQWGVAQVMAVR